MAKQLIDNIPEVECHEAFRWMCPKCGRDHYFGVVYVGSYRFLPTTVRCKSCRFGVYPVPVNSDNE